MNRLLILALLRELRRHPGQAWLALLGIALGVAVAVAVELTNASARHSFELAMQRLVGQASHRIEGVNGVPEAFYVRLRIKHGIRTSSPLVRGLVRIQDETFELFGIDPLAWPESRELAGDLRGLQLERLLNAPGSFLLGRADAQRLGLAQDAQVQLNIAGQTQMGRLIGQFGATNPGLSQGLLITDIATAQEWLDQLGRLDRINLKLTAEQARTLRAELPGDLRLQPVEDAGSANLTRAFRTNLTAMGLLSLLVGGLLVYNAMSFAVVRRRRLFGQLRLIGATQRQLAGLILAEAALLGLIGSVLGLVLGWLLATGLIGLVTQTINDLYATLTISQLHVSPSRLLLGLGLGLGISLLAAAIPAREAARVSPKAATQRSLGQRINARWRPRLLLAGLLLIGLAFGLLALEPSALVTGFVAIFLVIIGYALLLPAATGWLARLMRLPLFNHQPLLRMAGRNIAAGLGRSGVALAALTVAVAAGIGIGLMVDSFRGTVQDWLGQTLTSDLYVTLAEGAQVEASGLPEGLVDRLQSLDGIQAVSLARRRTIETEFGQVEVLALNDAPHVAQGFRFKSQLPNLWSAVRAGRALLISEPFANRYDLASGDVLQIIIGSRQVSFQIAGVYYDYSSERGLLVMDLQRFADLWRDRQVNTAGLVLADQAELPGIAQQVRALLAGYEQPLRLIANAEVQQTSLAIFDRTFAITDVLRLLSLAIAFIGVTSALTALLLERGREQATLRALGVTPGQLLGLVVLEAGLLGLAAGLFALPLGWLIAELLVTEINLRAFGWTLALLPAPGVMLQGLILAVLAALLAGLFPGYRQKRHAPADGLREE